MVPSYSKIIVPKINDLLERMVDPKIGKGIRIEDQARAEGFKGVQGDKVEPSTSTYESLDLTEDDVFCIST